jgi:hypothetical protein
MIKAQNISMLLGAIFLVLVAAGCQIVHVVDDNGDPIPWAKVQVAPNPSASDEEISMPVYTDLLGNAMISASMDASQTEWIIVSKEGYVTNPVSRGVEDKIEVQLHSEPTLPGASKRDDSAK